MINEEKQDFYKELCRRWPGKLNADDLDYWWRQLRSHQFGEVKEALTKFRNTSRFVPKPPEILKLLPRLVADEQKKAVEYPPLSEIVAVNMNIQRSASMAEKILRYWRSVWWNYKTNADTRRASMETAIKVCSQRQGISEAEFRARKTFKDTVEMWERQTNGMLDKCRVSCANCLIAEGMEQLDQARDYADWIETPPDHFRQFLSNLRATEMAEAFA